jgi:putative adenylate-forming enzyme
MSAYFQPIAKKAINFLRIVLFKLRILYYFILFTLRGDKRKSPEKLAKIRERRFQKLKKQLLKSPYYKEYVQEPMKLEDFPVIDKEIFMDHFDSINSRGIKKKDALEIAFKAEQSRDFSPSLHGITVGLSTGTSGNKGIFLVSKKEKAQWVAAMLDRVVGFSTKKRKIAFFLRANSSLYEASNSRLLSFNFFDLMAPFEQNFQRLNQLHADILIAQPSALRLIANSYQEQNIIPGFSKVISVAEVLESNDRSYLESVFQLQLDEVYQCTEGFLAFSCPHGNLHLNEDFLIIEKDYLDEDKKRYSPIITDLYRETQAVIRYKLNDILVQGIKCSCGCNFDVIEKIEGRTDDLIQLKNKAGKAINIFPDFFSRAISIASDQISYYELIQKKENSLSLYVEHHGNEEEIQHNLQKQIRDLLARFEVEHTEIQFIQSPELKKGQKLRRIRNEYIQTSENKS